MCTKRSLQELVLTEEPAWPLVQSWVQAATNDVEVLPADDEHRAEALLETQVTLRSPMGAVVYYTGGILIDHGWLRFLASGHPKLPRSMPAWNRARTPVHEGKPPGFWLIADDVIGGFYALNGGSLGPDPGNVYYFAPESLRWEQLNMSYSELLLWALGPNLSLFYEALRWPGWQDEVSSVRGDQALSIYPPLWTAEGKNISTCSRKPCSVSEIFAFNVQESN